MSRYPENVKKKVLQLFYDEGRRKRGKNHRNPSCYQEKPKLKGEITAIYHENQGVYGDKMVHDILGCGSPVYWFF